MKKLSFGLFLVFLVLNFAYAKDKITIKVALNISDSFFYDPNNPGEGVQDYLLHEINKVQKKYQLEGVPLPRKRQREWLANKKVDAIFLYNKSWGFDLPQILVSDKILRSRSFFVSLKEPERSQKYFDDFKNKEILGVLGYEYNIENSSQNQSMIHRVEVESHILDMLAKKRANIGIINSHVYCDVLRRKPEYKDKFLVSFKSEQEFDLNILLHKDSVLKPEEVNLWIKELKEKGKLNYIFRRYLGDIKGVQ